MHDMEHRPQHIHQCRPAEANLLDKQQYLQKCKTYDLNHIHKPRILSTLSLSLGLVGVRPSPSFLLLESPKIEGFPTSKDGFIGFTTANFAFYLVSLFLHCGRLWPPQL